MDQLEADLMLEEEKEEEETLGEQAERIGVSMVPPPEVEMEDEEEDEEENEEEDDETWAERQRVYYETRRLNILQGNVDTYDEALLPIRPLIIDEISITDGTETDILTPVTPTRSAVAAPPPTVLISSETELVYLAAERVHDKGMISEIYNEHASDLKCPLTLSFMRRPVVASDGQVYENDSIARHIRSNGPTSPLTNEALACTTLYPAHYIRKATEMLVWSTLGTPKEERVPSTLMAFLGLDKLPDPVLDVPPPLVAPSPNAPNAPRRPTIRAAINLYNRIIDDSPELPPMLGPREGIDGPLAGDSQGQRWLETLADDELLLAPSLGHAVLVHRA